MWKNFFYFSGSQRAGIILLVCLILLACLVNYFLPVFVEKEEIQTDSLFMAEIESFKHSLVSMDSLRKIEQLKAYKNQAYEYTNQSNYKKSTTHRLFDFNPNELDSAGFVTLGIKPYVASNILKYRKKGGQFKDKASFSRVYGISEEKFDELANYIQLPDLHTRKLDSSAVVVQKDELKQPLLVELNAADTAELMRIKGLGRGYARSIIRYRQQTGGFVRIEQLKEIYGMTTENYERIKPFCYIDQTLIQKIKINTASVDKLKSHPYLNFYQAKQIYELRRKRGKLSEIGDLSKLSELNDSTLAKIEAYINFE
ncbi:MAG: helix-hairpin-helix domain-containing protein [Paludibacter sp.]|nr:helix-hairpin-helix domain-containing protein [Paludibacter sp.]